MKTTAASAPSQSPAGGTLVAQDATVRSPFSKDLTGNCERELSMIAVEYPPGGTDPVHMTRRQP